MSPNSSLCQLLVFPSVSTHCVVTVFLGVSRSCSPNTVITSNTLRIDMSAAVERTENKAVRTHLHFCNFPVNFTVVLLYWIVHKTCLLEVEYRLLAI